MPTLKPEKLHVKFIGNSDPEGPASPRRYTLTHSDITGELFLSVGTVYDRETISGFYTRIMRDEVLAELLEDSNGPKLHVYCHVSGGLVVGNARWRYTIFKQHMLQVLQAFRYGDEIFFGHHPHFDEARVIVHFSSTNKRFNLQENWGSLADYRPLEAFEHA
ncbi:MAG TPA: hypothetical protein DEH22_06330 [Chloroflexi bacterium]|nr:hypothetical protein [Chloroflexota bacterium]